MAKVHTSSLLLFNDLLAAKPQNLLNSSAGSMPRSLSTVTVLVDASVFTALVHLCEYENTACPAMFVTASLPTMKRFCTFFSHC